MLEIGSAFAWLQCLQAVDSLQSWEGDIRSDLPSNSRVCFSNQMKFLAVACIWQECTMLFTLYESLHRKLGFFPCWFYSIFNTFHSWWEWRKIWTKQKHLNLRASTHHLSFPKRMRALSQKCLTMFSTKYVPWTIELRVRLIPSSAECVGMQRWMLLE